MYKRNHLQQSLLAAAVTTLWIVCASASDSGWSTNAQNVVLDGHDVVAYHSLDRAVKGDARYSADYDGAQFHFTNEENLSTFKAAPTKFIPKYKGYCAFAVGAKNAKVPANADTFKLYNGDLLVFFNDVHDGQKFNTKIPWNENERKLYQQAEKNWSAMK